MWIVVAQVLELEEPVEDELGYVYEKAGILGYINTETHKHPGRPVLCPMAGKHAGPHVCEYTSLHRHKCTGHVACALHCKINHLQMLMDG